MTSSDDPEASIFTEVEDFAFRLKQKDWNIDKAAGLIQIKHPTTGEKGSLAEHLGLAIADYEEKARIHIGELRKLEEHVQRAKARYSEQLEREAPWEVTELGIRQFHEGLDQDFKNARSDRLEAAKACGKVIGLAFAHGVVNEGEGLVRKLKECQDENNQLREDNHRLSNALKKTTTAFQEYQKRVRPAKENEV